MNVSGLKSLTSYIIVKKYEKDYSERLSLITDIEYFLRSDYFKVSANPFDINKDEISYDISYYSKQPSNKSFYIFGGFYDPEDGLFYIGNNNRMECVILFDFVDFLFNLKGKIFGKDVITSYLQKYKILGKDSVLKNDFDNYRSYQELSIVKRNISTIVTKNKNDNEDFSNSSDILDIFKKVNSIIYGLERFSYITTSNFTQKYSKDMTYFYTYLDHKTDKNNNLYDTTLQSTNSPECSTFRKTKTFNMPVRRALNVLDVLGDIDLIYSSDTDKMLRNYGVDKLVSERDFKLIKKNLGSFLDTGCDIHGMYSYYKELGIYSINTLIFQTQGDYKFLEVDSLSNMSLEISLINKSIRKIK